jgi:hypothetical protein
MERQQNPGHRRTGIEPRITLRSIRATAVVEQEDPAKRKDIANFDTRGGFQRKLILRMICDCNHPPDVG